MSYHSLPAFIYGTAWKEEATLKLVEQAVLAGFRAIDTANQPKHYQEPLVGEALLRLARHGVRREQLYLQSKFTPLGGQDHRLPYDPAADLKVQVEQSFRSTLKNLQTDYLESYLLHGPYFVRGLSSNDLEIWEAMEELYQSGQVRSIGISNVNAEHLELLCKKATIKPMVVQNRCYAELGWDKTVREFCTEHKIAYQGFSLLTANLHVLQDERIIKMAAHYKVGPAQLVFRFATQIGMIPLTGTTNEQHMEEDLAIFDFELGAKELKIIESTASTGSRVP